MSTAASATRPTRCSRSASRRSKAASAPSPPPAARRRCTWRSPRWPAPARTSSPARALYGGSHNLLHYTLARFGIETTFVKPGDIDGWRAAIRPEHQAAVRRDARQPRASTCSTSRPSARSRTTPALPLLVDSTFTTPWLMKPFDHGADLVYHSATKFLSGHGTVIGGVLVDSGRFDWERVGRFPELSAALRRLPRHGVQRGEHASARSCCARAARACATSAPA